MTQVTFAEYIWIDGTKPVPLIRSKTKLMNLDYDNVTIESFDEWSFDGSSTSQASGDNSDCILKPVNFVDDPIRGAGSYLVLCEVFNPDGTAHVSNTRSILRKYLDEGGKAEDPWLGFEQEYTLYHQGNPFGWPENGGYPAPQGPYYCGVGTEQVSGRELVEDHARACVEAGIMIYGTNAEVMLGQWEFQIGYRGIAGEDAGALEISDHTWLARWLLYRIAEDYEIEVRLDNKPVKGDWNGAGMHTNISTNSTRDPKSGLAAIKKAVKKLEATHEEHIAVYGHLLSERLTGEYETSSITNFSSGSADRGCSIRIPKPVELKGCGYFEDRRPGANSDPYEVAAVLIKSICLNDGVKKNKIA